MKTIKFILWNFCDDIVLSHPKIFKLSAYALYLIGDNYWINSPDYKGKSIFNNCWKIN